MRNQVQLITYVDRLGGGDLTALRRLLAGPLAGVFGGVHLLPFYHAIDGADAGYDPIDHGLVDPRLGTWDDVRALAGDLPVMADLIVNHISADSPEFTDYAQHGADSRFHGLFLTRDRVFRAEPTPAELAAIFRPRPRTPFTTVRLASGEERVLWTTFTEKQIDIDVEHPLGAGYLAGLLERFEAGGVSMIRLDAVGYAIKRPGTRCFMLPETYDFIASLARQARARGMETLVEIHSYHRDQIEIARHVDRVYDFALPPLVLHTLYRANARALKSWLAISPRNAITVLDTHDGIGIVDAGADPVDRAARPGLLSPAELDALVETIHARSNGASRRATGAAADNLDLYQVNCTYYDALGRNDRAYLVARAIQFFAPGVPQVYYVGFLAGENDLALLERTSVGRDINRHYFTPAEIDIALARPVVRDLVALIRLRNRHPAFAGEFAVRPAPEHMLHLAWALGADWIELRVDLRDLATDIVFTTDTGAVARHSLFAAIAA